MNEEISILPLARGTRKWEEQREEWRILRKRDKTRVGGWGVFTKNLRLVLSPPLAGPWGGGAKATMWHHQLSVSPKEVQEPELLKRSFICSVLFKENSWD